LDSQPEEEQPVDEQVEEEQATTAEPVEEKKREPGDFPTRRERKLTLAKKNQEWEPQVMLGQSKSRWPWENLSWQWMWQNFGDPVYIEHSIDVTESGELQIVSYQGDLFIRGWDQPSLRINGAVFDARIGQEDDTIRLASSTGQLHIWIPAGIKSVSVRTEPGDVWLSNISADVEVNCQSGDLICQRLEGSIDAEADGGDVRLMGVDGAVKIDICGLIWIRSGVGSSNVKLLTAT